MSQQPGIWNPQEEYDLDPETGQYTKRTPTFQTYSDPSSGAGGTDWGSIEKQLREMGGGLYDPSDLEGIKRNTGYNEPGKAVSLEQALASQRGIYQQRAASNGPGYNGPSPQQATAQYSGNTSAAGAGDAALGQFMQYLQGRDSAQQQQQAALREILMSQLGQAQQPVSADSPGIRDVLSGRRLALQRGAERERRNAAELRAYDGSGGLGGKAFDTDVRGILERQSEADARMTGDVLGQELSAKRDQIQRLLTLAMSLGDSESARTLSAQLNAIQTQLQQSNFYDDSAYRYAALNQQGNLSALLALLNAA